MKRNRQNIALLKNDTLNIQINKISRKKLPKNWNTNFLCNPFLINLKNASLYKLYINVSLQYQIELHLISL